MGEQETEMNEGWREIRRRALDTYWLRRRNGGSENEALSAVLDDIYRDDTIEEVRRDMRDTAPPPRC